MAETVFVPLAPGLHSLISDIEEGALALPELQRPFVWKRSKVRDLLDSMYRGYPVGYLLFWKTPEAARIKQIAGVITKAPSRVIVDGQQRLTSLYAVFRGQPVMGEDFEWSRIRIAFRPSDGRFDVANSATDRDPEFLPDISVLWNPDIGPFKTRKTFFERLRKARPDIDDSIVERLEEAIGHLHNLQSFPFSALELRSSLNEEEVAEIFVRINSEGVTLNQADFILTLMSVFWDDGRRQLEAFSRAAGRPAHGQTPYNVIIAPSPDQLLRVAVGLAFERAVLSAVYSLLRGKDLNTKKYSDESRDRQFQTLKEAQSFALDLTNWHEFLKAARHAGYRTSKTVASQNGLMYAYTLYLIGRRRFGMDHKRLREVVARWLFMTALTGRYTGSSETVFEKDLTRLRDISTPDEFESVLDHIIDLTLTNDFWSTTLPSLLATSSSRSPYLLAYDAALCVLRAPALFSDVMVNELLDLVAQGKRSHVERHHLFPSDHLEKLGIKSANERNQIANLAIVEWTDNAMIGSSDPSKYWPAMTSGLIERKLAQMVAAHALPNSWASMPYQEFLEKRRLLIAGRIREAFNLLRHGIVTHEAEEARPSIAELVSMGESAILEFKSTARLNLHTGQRDERLEHKILVNLAGFMNTDGGTLVVGVADDGVAVGLDQDFALLKRKDADGWRSWLSDLVENGLGKPNLANLDLAFEGYQEKNVCRIEVRHAKRPVWVKATTGAEFYVRFDNSTRQLFGEEILQYVADRWGDEMGQSTGAVA